MGKAILLSGGMDSISLAYWKRPEIAVTVNYGQAAAETELRVSNIIAGLLGMQHVVIDVDCSSLGSGDLVNRAATEAAPSTEWWPFRNQLLITLASMRLIGSGVDEIMLASVKTDSFHKDGTADFYRNISKLLEEQEGGIKVTAPCLHLTTHDLVITSGIDKETLYWAHSCHKSNIACGQCRGCYKYQESMNLLGYVEY